jgi:hypothetical protein
MAKFDNQKAIAYLRQKWGGRVCPMCGVGNWSVNESTFQLTEFNNGSMIIGGPVVPVVPVICMNCGNTVLVNAITAGLVTPPEGGKS